MPNQNDKTIINSDMNADTHSSKKSQNFLSRFNISPSTIKYGLIILTVLAISIGGYYWYAINQRIYTDKAEIFAPLITLGPAQPAVLQQVMVKNGDVVSANKTLARLDNNQYIRAKTDGIVVGINDQIGKLFSPGTAVVTMVNPEDLRLIAHVAENKGLNSVSVGQKVIFTVDAFDSRKFYGVIEEIAQTSDQSSVVFSISDKRAEKDFSIKIKYDNYPELLNGMSAKAWIYK